MALTATATPKAEEDIVKQLGLRKVSRHSAYKDLHMHPFVGEEVPVVHVSVEPALRRCHQRDAEQQARGAKINRND